MSDPTNSPPSGAASTRRISASRGATTRLQSDPHFSQPVRQIVMMLAVLALVLAGAWIAYGRILPIFQSNLWLNGLILAVFGLGVLTCFWQVGQLVGSVVWIERFAQRRRNAVEKGIAARAETGADDAAPRLLAPLAALLGARGPAGGVISTGSARSILDSVATRIDEIRDVTRYLSNLLIFLGLLGTFYGLATTIPAVVETIRALAPQEGESGLQVFDKLMGGLEAQLGGMATAFSSSLLGLAGSLVVGLLELFVTHGQNRFYRELEEWMTGFTSVSLASADGDGVDQAAMSGFVSHMAGQIDRLQEFHAQRDAIRDEASVMADERVIVMAEALEALVKRAEADRDGAQAQIAQLSDALSRLAQGQDQMLELARTRADTPARTPDLGGVEVALNRLATDLGESRNAMLADLRADLLVLTRAVRAARFNDPFRDDLLADPPVHLGRRG